MAPAILDQEPPATATPAARPHPSNAAPPVFHPVPIDPTCPHCLGERGQNDDAATGLAVHATDWSFADAAYCISLDDRDDRMTEASREFHRTGLCRRVLFHRPARHPTRVIEGIWEAHRAIAGHAIARGAEKVLVFEDDVRFTRNITTTRLAEVRAALERLPADWTIFFLGHWPLRARFFTSNTLLTRSACAHAYLASPRLLRWLDAHPFGHPAARRDERAGAGIDAAYARLDGCYAYFPMLAIQGILGSDHMAEKIRTRPIKKLRHLVTRTRFGEILLSRLMRPNEFVIAGIGAIAGVIEQLGLRRPTS